MTQQISELSTGALPPVTHNPLVFGWQMVSRPQQLADYRQANNRAHSERSAAWLSSGLLWAALGIPALGMLLGRAVEPPFNLPFAAWAIVLVVVVALGWRATEGRDLAHATAARAALVLALATTLNANTLPVIFLLGVGLGVAITVAGDGELLVGFLRALLIGTLLAFVLNLDGGLLSALAQSIGAAVGFTGVVGVGVAAASLLDLNLEGGRASRWTFALPVLAAVSLLALALMYWLR
jgi:hypothetical protein